MSPFVVVLGIAQDGGVPQAGCRADCCAGIRSEPQRHRKVACLGIVDPQAQQRWLIDCTPDFPHQLDELNRCATGQDPGVDAILLTHAHVGHYAGLIHLGREVMDARLPLFAMPRMRAFLQRHLPWSDLVANGNIVLRELHAQQPLQLSDAVSVEPFCVPHRGEHSETVGFTIRGPRHSALYVPDIDSWEGPANIANLICDCDAAYLDGTFFSSDELPGRNLNEIPHPTLVESMKYFAGLSAPDKDKIHFLHFNHSNPVLNSTSGAAQRVQAAGHHLSTEGETFQL